MCIGVPFLSSINTYSVHILHTHVNTFEVHVHDEVQLPLLRRAIYHTGLDVKMEILQCAGHVSANIRHHQLRWGGREWHITCPKSFTMMKVTPDNGLNRQLRNTFYTTYTLVEAIWLYCCKLLSENPHVAALYV